ncbi:hypothetical protein N7507_000074 [Penicillium longicatenatum]|nr:hypothetical protein N7507_000074 [Penicillium longicatenatum]
MRVGKGCGRCRHRHIRCVIPPGATACAPCTRLGRDCQLDPRFQFKAVHHVYQKSQGSAARFDLNWDEGQVWVDVSKPVTFILEADELNENQDIETPREGSLVPPWSAHEALHANNDIMAEERPAMQPLPQEGGEQLHPACTSPQTSAQEQGSTLSLREASLIRCFIQKIAPWADICDPQSHFSTLVPQRALQVPMVLKAVLALAARHDAIMTGKSDLEASSYLGQCLELLIPALDKPEHTYDESLLITVVILRICEELENNTDEKFHLLGSNRLINLMSRSASSGGLSEAVSWQFLRQAIYASIVQHQPLQLNLHNYECSAMFQRNDDAAVANMIVFHCANIIQLCRDVPRMPVDETTWHRISYSVEEWHRSKPPTWQPLRYQPPDATADRPFPEIWMMSGPAVVGMQYFHTARIFITLSDPHSQSMSDYELARSRRVAERTIATHMLTVVGLSWSNESVENGYFMACHLLHRFGYCLHHPAEQQGSLRFLSRVEEVLGWRTAWIKEQLERQWTELAEVDPPNR